MARSMQTAVAVAIVVALALAVASIAEAQEREQDEAGGEVVVTGTRIQQTSGMDTPTPVAALSATEIADMAPGSLVEAMGQLPQFYANATASNFNSGVNGFFNS